MSTEFLEEYEKPEIENLRSLLENLVFRLPACDGIYIRKILQEVYRDFCRTTCVLNFIQKIKCDDENKITISPFLSGGEIEAIVDVYCGNRKLTSNIDYKVLGKDYPIIKLNANYANEEIKVMHIEVPGLFEESAPRWFIKRYGDALISGTLARLMSITGKAWSDANMAMLYWREYENAKNEARNRYHADAELGNGDLGFCVDNSELV